MIECYKASVIRAGITNLRSRNQQCTAQLGLWWCWQPTATSAAESHWSCGSGPSQLPAAGAEARWHLLHTHTCSLALGNPLHMAACSPSVVYPLWLPPEAQAQSCMLKRRTRNGQLCLNECITLVCNSHQHQQVPMSYTKLSRYIWGPHIHTSNTSFTVCCCSISATDYRH